jgi:hypothetical protein
VLGLLGAGGQLAVALAPAAGGDPQQLDLAVGAVHEVDVGMVAAASASARRVRRMDGKTIDLFGNLAPRGLGQGVVLQIAAPVLTADAELHGVLGGVKLDALQSKALRRPVINARRHQRLGQPAVVERRGAHALDRIHQDELSPVLREVIAIPEAIATIEPMRRDARLVDTTVGLREVREVGENDEAQGRFEDGLAVHACQS